MKKLSMAVLIALSLLQAEYVPHPEIYTITRNGEICSTHPAMTVAATIFLTAFVYGCANGNVSKKTN